MVMKIVSIIFVFVYRSILSLHHQILEVLYLFVFLILPLEGGERKLKQALVLGGPLGYLMAFRLRKNAYKTPHNSATHTTLTSFSSVATIHTTLL